MSSVLAELDLPHEITGPGTVSVVDGDVEFRVVQRVERHFLMRVEVAEFRVPLSLRAGEGRIVLRRQGRGGRSFKATAKPATDDLVASAHRLEADDELQDLYRKLDAKKTVVEVGPNESVAAIRNVGLSRVVMAMPPTRKYVSAGAEQVVLLRATIAWLAEFV